MQNGQPRRHLLVRRVSVPIGRTLDAEPVDVAVLVNIGQPGHLGKIGMAVIDQRMDLRYPEAAPESRKLYWPQILVPKHQHRMFSERILDPGEGLGVERLR